MISDISSCQARRIIPPDPSRLQEAPCHRGMPPQEGRVHTVFSAECNPTFDWHAIALFYSHRVSGQPGNITRLLACSDAQLRTYRGLDIGPTFVHQNYRHVEGMNYAAFNKPASVTHWLASGAAPRLHLVQV